MNQTLSIDLGSVRIGLALSDELGWMAHPWQTLSRSPRSVQEIATLAAEKKVTTIVVGLPRNLNGTYGPAAEHCRAFAQELQGATEAKVVLWDERFTTVMATRQLQAAGRNQKQQRSIIDQAAAQQILQDWIDAQQQISQRFT
jgi:putative Holliday junction resolvase